MQAAIVACPGLYLAEVLRRIDANLQKRGLGALAGACVKQAATQRVFGFEIMPAPFVVAHLQVGLTMQDLDASLDEEGVERPGVFLTNALTGWEPEIQKPLPFPELEEERDRVCLSSAASRAGLQEWAEYVGDWLTELALTLWKRYYLSTPRYARHGLFTGTDAQSHEGIIAGALGTVWKPAGLAMQRGGYAGWSVVLVGTALPWRRVREFRVDWW